VPAYEPWDIFHELGDMAGLSRWPMCISSYLWRSNSSMFGTVLTLFEAIAKFRAYDGRGQSSISSCAG
jgi:hypothetical protein